MSFFRKLFTAPVFDDEQKTQQAYLLHIILWALVCVPIPFFLYTFIREPDNSSRAFVQTAFGEAVNITLLLMLRRGYVRAASIIQVSAFWFFFTATAFTGSGVQGEAYLLGYGLVIAIAGILFGGPIALIFTFLSLAAGAWMVYGQMHGIIISNFESAPLTTWVVSLALFPVGAILQHLASRTLRVALTRARASEEKYRLISQVSSDYTFASDVDMHGQVKLIWVAGAFEKMTGYTFEEYAATGGWLTHVHPEDLEKDSEDMNKLLKNQNVINSDIRTYAKNGEIRWERIFAHPVWDEKENQLIGIVGAVQDVTQEKQAEQKIIETLLQQSAILNGIPDMAWLKDINSRYIAVNEQFAKTAGMKMEEIAGKTDFDIWQKNLAIKYRNDDLEVIQTRQRKNTEEFQIDSTGREFWVETTKTPILNSEGEVIGTTGIAREITERKKAEEVEQYRRIMLEKVIKLGKQATESDNLISTVKKIWHGVHDDLGFDRLAIFLFNPERNSMDDTVGTNNAGEMVDHWNISFPIDSTFADLLQNPNGVYFTHNYGVENKIPEGHEMYSVQDYVAVAAWVGDKPVAVICADQGITQRAITAEQLEALRLFAGYAGLAIENARLDEKIQNELLVQTQAKEREENRRAILEKVVTLGQRVTEVFDLRTTLTRIWHGVHDDLGFDRLGIYLYNPERISMDGTFGTSDQGEMVDEWHTWVSIEQDNPESKSFLHVLEKPDTIYLTHTYEDDYKIPSGHIMSGVQDFAAIAAWAGEKPVAAICVDNVITGRPITEEQLEALRLFAGYAGLAIENTRLNSALQNELALRKKFIVELEAKNAELERFTYTVSHDLKSPLVTIKGFLGYLEKDAYAGNFEKFQKDVYRIETAVEKMQNLLKDLLELSRIGRVMNTPVEISFHEIVKTTLEIMHGQLEAKKVLIEYQNNNVILNCDQVRMTEVLQNLIDNAIKFMGDQPKPRIEIDSFINDKKETVIYIKDNGIGIAPEFHGKIFGLFNKLNTDSDGTGVGLSLVKRIIEVHGGRIWMESQVGKGTTFYFTIPTSNR